MRNNEELNKEEKYNNMFSSFQLNYVIIRRDNYKTLKLTIFMIFNIDLNKVFSKQKGFDNCVHI